MLPFERMQGPRVVTFGDNQVDGLRARVFDVGTRGVDVRVVRHRLARSADSREKNLLGGAPLVRRKDVFERKQFADAVEEAEPRRRAGLRLVAALYPGPLLCRHRAGAGVGEQVYQDVLRAG